MWLKLSTPITEHHDPTGSLAGSIRCTGGPRCAGGDALRQLDRVLQLPAACGVAAQQLAPQARGALLPGGARVVEAVAVAAVRPPGSAQRGPSQTSPDRAGST